LPASWKVSPPARGRGGQEAASAALERAAELTPSAGDARGRRRYAAAVAAWLGGQPIRARALADTALDEVADPCLRADVALLRARVEWNTGSLDLGHRMVVTAAEEVASADLERARELGMFAAALASIGAAGGRDVDPEALVPSARDTDSTRARCFDDLMRGLGDVSRRDWAGAAHHLRSAFAMSGEFDDADQDLLPNVGVGAMHLQDDETLLRVHTRMLIRARDTGAALLVLYALSRRGFGEITTGEWVTARAGLAEARQIATA
jgi:hypothetical protein